MNSEFFFGTQMFKRTPVEASVLVCLFPGDGGGGLVLGKEKGDF